VKAILTLADGTTFQGESIGRPGRTLGEVVFDTAMVGYQQAFTDPSFRGQILTLTYPLIGNYGTNEEDYESPHCQIAGLVVKEVCSVPSNFRSQETLDAFLKRHGVVGITGVDTRALTRKLRHAGVMMGAVSTDETPAQVLQRIQESPSYSDVDFVDIVTTEQPYEWRPKGAADTAADRLPVVVLDFGIRTSILHNLWEQGCQPLVMPSHTTADQVLAAQPRGLLLSPGPGDPAKLGYAVDTVRSLLGKLPIFGICLGNHLLTYALGGTVFKLKFGHRGGNHPVRDLATGRVRITSQNHGFAADPDSLKDAPVTISHINLNDGTVEGLESPDLHAYSIQYHAEASPGPRDSRGIFKQLVQRLRNPDRWTEILPETT
jgi:carbamoyl-phosphate synthase small subunit